MNRDLTQLERQVLALVLKGKSNKQIAGEIGADEPCVKARIRRAYEKLGIRTTRELLSVVEVSKDTLNLVS